MSAVLSPEELREIAKNAEDFAKKHIVEIGSEMLEWRDTSILRNGCMRELADMLRPLATDAYALSVAESYALRAAYEFVVQQGKASE